METILARFAWLSGERAVGEINDATVCVNSPRSHKRNAIQNLRVADRALRLTLKV
jgi:hypothetical protein